MKNFTPFGRLLLLAVFLLSAVGLSAQTVCGINGPVTISAEPACQSGFPSPQPFVVVDLGPGSGLINGPVNVTVQPVYNNIFPGPPVEAIGVIANNGFIAFETPENSVFSAFNIKIRLIEITIVGSCTQNFEINPIESASFSMVEASRVQSVTKNTTRSIDPPCPGIATGRISANLVPTSGPFTATRFSAEIYPPDAFIQVFGPSSGPNNDPNSYLIETTAALEAGNYDIVISDNQSTTGCVVVYNAVVGDPNNTLTALATTASASCFGVADGSITVGVATTINPQVNGTIFVEYSIGNGTPIQAGQLQVIANEYQPFTISGLAAGSYNVNLTSSATGCSDDATVFVSEPAEIEVTASADPVCADAGTFDFTLTGVSGLDPSAQYRLIDATFFDNDNGNNNGCWTRPPSGRDPIAPGLQMDGSYRFTMIDLASTPGCYSVNQDTLVTLYLELRNPNGCRDTFSFPLQINAKPITPVVTATANVGGDLINDLYCSGQDIVLNVADYDPAFTYEISYTEVPSVVAGGAAAANDTFPYVDGNTVVSFMNNTDFLATIDFLVTKTDAATGCTSAAGSFSTRIRPEPTVDPIFNNEVVICSAEQFVSELIEVNGSNNGNITYNFVWTLNNPGPDFTFDGQFTGNNDSNTSVSGTFNNTSGTDQTATLTITPVFVQQNTVVGGGTVDNTCEGQPATIDVTVTSRPTLSYDLTIGDLNTTLTSGSTSAFEICNGQDFLLDNLMIAESNSEGLAKYVRYRVRGDARFLQINTNGSNFDLTDIQTTQFLPIDNFAIGQPNIQNNHPDNNAQVAEIILTPYFEDVQNGPNFPLCAGEPVRLFLTVNPTPPMLPSPQSETVCSDERIEYTIMGASGNGSTLQTRITETNVFPGQTVGSFTVPEGADRIDNFRFTLRGANGGGTTTTGGTGGLGGQVTGMLDANELLPGDVVNIRKGLAGGANNRNGDGGDATILTVTRNGTIVYTFVAAGGGGAGSGEDGQNGLTFTNNMAADGVQGQGPGGFGGTGFPTALGGNGNINGGGGGGGYRGGNGGNSQSGQSGRGGASFRSTVNAPASFAQKTNTQLAEGEAEIFYTVVYDDILFDDVVVDFDSDSLTEVGEAIVNGEVDTILFGQQFVNNTNNPQDVTYTLTPVTQANCGDMSTIAVVVTIEPVPMATIASGSTTTVSGNATDGYTATVCSGDSINAILNSLTMPSGGVDRLYFEVVTTTSIGTNIPGNATGAASNTPRFDVIDTGLPIDFFERRVVNNTGADGTITYTITPYIGANMPIIPSNGPNLRSPASSVDCVGDPITFTVTVQPGFNVSTNQPVVDVCSREALNTVFDLDASQAGSINIAFDQIRIEGFRVSTQSADFTFSGLDTTGLAAGGFLLNRTGNFFNDAVFTNRTGGGVGVEFDVVFISEDGCESGVVTYPFNIRAEPIIAESNTAITICEGEATGLSVMAAANSAFFNNFAPNDVTFSYTLDAGNLVETSGDTYPVSGVGAFRANNDTFENPTSTPQTATYTVVATSRFGCASQPVTYTVTVEPSPELTVTASQGSSTITGEVLLADIETLTICSGSTVSFALSQDVSGTGVSYRIQRVVTGTVTNGNGSAIDNFEGGLAIGGFQETLANTSTVSATVQYNLAAYTYGRNGMDDDGLNAFDDCVGVTKRLIVEVLPATTDEASLSNNLTVNNPNVGPTNPGSGAQICDNSEVLIRPVTTIDPSTGVAFIWSRENDGTMLGGATSGSGGFNTTQNANNVYPAPNSDRIQQVLTAQDGQTTEVRYIVTLYSFGTDGVDDMLAPGSDDCPGDIDTVTVQLDPTPVLTADLEIGTAPVVSLNAAGSRYIYEICSGEDFLLDNLAFPETATGKAKYVQFIATGQTDFLGLPQGGPLNFYSTVAPTSNFSLGTQNVQNTSGNNSAQTAFLTLIPYFEDGNDDASRDGLECAGEPILITVTINPTPPTFAPLTETVCSEEEVSYTIPGASNQGGQFRSRVAGSTTFDGSNDFVVPIGAAAIRAIDITVNGANGGTSAGNRGGLGGVVETSLNPFPAFPSADPTLVFPGDTIRVRKGVAGASGATNGGGGDASFLCIIAGPNSPFGPPGAIVETLLAGGGGGAGFAESGADAGAEESSAASDGADGTGLGGFGGTGWDPMNPQAGSFGGAGRGNGGGGGGGWNGGDGGSNLSGLAGGFGTSYTGGPPMPSNQVNADFFTKGFSDAAGGTVRMDYTLVYNDVQFTLTNLAIGTGLTNVSPDPLTVGDTDTDTILFGEQFLNDTDGPVDVVYTFSTSSEANCPGGEVTVTLTVEPNPTLDLASNGTMITDNGDGTYTADICSGDSLSAILSSMTIPSQGTNVVRARVIDVETSSMEVTFGTGDGGEASASVNLNGNNQPSTNDLPFYEASISNVGDTNGTVTYTVVPYIINTVGSSGVECAGDTLILTVTVYPEFVGVAAGPIQENICSNVSLDDAGFDLDATQPVQIVFDSIIIDNVTNTAGGDMNFETISSVYSGTPVTVIRSEGFFNTDTYRNRTGAPVFVTYTVRLVSGPGCTSDPILYQFRYTAEPVIDIVESATNQIDTVICSGDMTGLIVVPAANSAFPGTAATGPTSFQANVDLMFSINLPTGVTLTKANGSYPNTTGGRAFMRDDILTNNTAGPLDVLYTVAPVNGTCEGDAVTYTVTVNPNPFADVTLTSLDSTETFGLDNSRLSVSPNPRFGVCSGQALTATVPSVSAVATGMLMVDFEISADANGISGFPAGVFTFPASELADSLSYAAGELVNMTGAPQFFTVEYRAYIEANGTPGFQNDGVDCQSDGIIQFDVVVNPTNTADVTVRFNDGSTTAIPTGQDTLCSGEVFDLAVKALNNNPNPQIDSFVVTVDVPTGLETGPGTFSTDTTLLRADFSNVPAQLTRLLALSFTNATPGIKTVTYTATPYTMGCAGIPDTTTISYRAEIMLEANEPVLCADPGVSTSIFAIDANGGMLSATAGEYRYQYIGGTASGYSLSTSTGGNLRFVGDPATQANTIVYNNQLSVTVTPSSNPAFFTPGTLNFQVIYDDVANGCGVVTDTITIMFQTTAEAGVFNQGLGIRCDEVNFVLSGALLGADEGGVFTFTNGNPGLGALNGANFTPMVGGDDPTPVAIDFTYTVGGGNSGCATASVDFSIMVEPAPNAGTYVGTPGEACESAPAFNLFDLLTGEMQNGTFTQTAGVDFVTVNSDGTIDQDNITPGLYTFTYTVTSANGCGSDVTTGIAVQVNSREDCTTFVPCDVITLTAGFNVISFDVVPNDNTVESIFADQIANNNLLTVVALYADIGQPQSYTFVPGFGGINNIQGGLRPGYGYIVEVASDVTVELCGPAVDPDLRVELLSGLNIVGYAGASPESVFTYFDELISNSDLVLARTRTNGQTLETIFQPFIFGNLINVENSLGYIIDVNSAYGDGTWRDNGPLPTSAFDRLYGVIENGEEFVGETLSFTDAEGVVVGQTEVLEGGIYMNTFLFGDLETTERVREGLTAGETFFAELRGERIATGLAFGGDWRLNRLDLDFSGLSTDVPSASNVDAFSMRMFPNPTADVAQVELNLPVAYDYVRIELFSLLGQVVGEQTIEEPVIGSQQVALDLRALPAGTYQVRITTASEVLANRQIVKQ